ncbi:MAG: AAA family ATPase [Planctomycetota bacterium]
MYLPQLSPHSVRVLTEAARQSTRAEHHFLGVEHLFLGLIEEEETGLADALASHGVDIPRLHAAIQQGSAAEGHHPWGDEMIYSPRCHAVIQLAGRIAGRRHRQAVEPSHLLEAVFREGRSVPLRLLRGFGADLTAIQASLQQETPPPPTETPLLDKYGNDLTALARAGALVPVIGRDSEQDKLQEVLLRKNKNNPVLVGEAGVGKTAIVEGFAQRVVQPNCPDPFVGARVIELSVASLVAGTKFRGEFEERLLGILDEARANKNVILFLDEAHTLVGGGSSGGDSLDAANILKPALARGDIRVIGATTIAEYRRGIEKDAALDRRFDKILVEEPTEDDTLRILRAVRPSFEAHHGVEIHERALEAALQLTMRHLPERRLPDKALDALDQSCARCRLKALRGTSAESEANDGPTIVSENDVRQTVAQWTGIPVERLAGDTLKGLLNLEKHLKLRVVGQDAAVEAVARAVLTARAGLAPPQRPIGVFLFLGPTGVGKTELAKSLAGLLFGDERRLVRFDMSEYSEPHSVAKLIGAPPGYVGYEEEGLLIAAVRTHPHSVVLFDEIEKAHPQLSDLFLQIFDDGRLSGAHGHSADFRQAVVILTSNVVLEPEEAAGRLGFQAGSAGEPKARGASQDAGVRRALTKFFRPELVNRIDEILRFQPLGPESLRKIIDRYVGEIEDQLATLSVSLELADSAYSYLARRGESDMFGARELRRVVDHEIRQALAERLLRAGSPIHRVRVQAAGDQLEFDLS